jgi:hypothetical protein
VSAFAIVLDLVLEIAIVFLLVLVIIRCGASTRSAGRDAYDTLDVATFVHELQSRVPNPNTSIQESRAFAGMNPKFLMSTRSSTKKIPGGFRVVDTFIPL